LNAFKKRAGWWAAALLAVAALILYRRFLPIGGQPSDRVVGDTFGFSFPYVVLISRSLAGGAWPAWNPYEFGGTPFWGNLQSLLFHPPTLLVALGKVTLVRFQLVLVAQIALGAIGMFVWLRARTDSTLAALAGGALFLGSGGVINFVSHYQQLTLYCLLPWPFAFYELWRTSEERRWLFGAALALAVWSTSSYPSQLGYYCITFVIFYMTRPWRRRTRVTLAWEIGLLAVAAPALTAIHWWPALRLLPVWSRGHGLPLASITALGGHPAQLFSVGFAALAGAPSELAHPDITLRSAHVGLVALFAALYALGRPTVGRALLALAALACADLCMRGSLLLPIVHRLSPLSANSYYPAVEFGSLFCFLFITLAAEGLADLARDGWQRRPSLVAVVGVVIFVVAFYAGARGYFRLPLAATLVPLLVSAGLVAGGWLASRRGRTIGLALVAAAAFHNSLTSVEGNLGILGTHVPPEAFARYDKWLADHAANFTDLRARTTRRSTHGELSHRGIIEGWRSDGGYDASQPAIAVAALADPAAHAALTDPRAAFAFDIAMPDFGAAQVAVTSYSLNHIRYFVNARLPMLLVFNELAVPGWRLTIDGNPRPLVTTDRWFRAALVPAGEHQLALDYRPPGLATGAALSVAGALAFLLLAFAGLVTRRGGGRDIAPASRRRSGEKSD
jgi:hypothetical protein